MNIYKVKQLFFEATNAKVVVGGDTEYSINKLRKHHLSAELGRYMALYYLGLAHYYFVRLEAQMNLMRLLSYSARRESASSYISIHSGLLNLQP